MLGVADEITQHYLNRVTVKDSPNAAACPFHKGGQERHPSFWIERSTGKWGCFTCTMYGSSLKYLLKELKVNNRTIEVELKEAEKDAKKTEHLRKAKKRKKDKADFRGIHILPEGLLGVFDYLPVSLINSGFSEEILESHNIGFDRRNRRITFPIRDLYGNLIGVSGRATRPEDHPKYKLYDGQKLYGRNKVDNELGEWFPGYTNDGVRDHLWRGNLVYRDLFDGVFDQLIIVEGFKAALWMVQNGWFHTVAVMGTKMTATQARIIRRLGASVFVFADNNEPGREAAYYWCQTLAIGSFPVYRVEYPDWCGDNAQPDDLTEEQLTETLENAKRVGGKPNVQLRRMEPNKGRR
jgi:DNA primase